jgi:hypothetical protein
MKHLISIFIFLCSSMLIGQVDYTKILCNGDGSLSITQFSKETVITCYNYEELGGNFTIYYSYNQRLKFRAAQTGKTTTAIKELLGTCGCGSSGSGGGSDWSRYGALESVGMNYYGFDTLGDLNFAAEKSINFDNGSKIHVGSTDAGYGGAGGVELECSVQYKLKWDAGRLFTMDQSNNIRMVEHQLYQPTGSDDITKGYIVGSRWIQDDGRTWLCINNIVDETFWLETDNIKENSIHIKANGTPSYNGETLRRTYEYAKLLTPNENPLATNNRFTIFLDYGHYNLEGNFNLDARFIDLKGITTEKAIFTSHINLTANDVRVSDIDCGTYRFIVASDLDSIILKNIRALGDYSFGGSDDEFAEITFSGIAIDCDAGNYSFGYGTVIGTFSGVAINCIAANYSFGAGQEGYFNGRVENCIGYDFCFGYGSAYSEFNGYAKNCSLHSNGFSYSNGVAYFNYSGVAENCNITTGAGFGSGSDYGYFLGYAKNCFALEKSFGRGGNAGEFSGVAEYCKSNGVQSFGGGDSGYNSGKAINCISEDNSFGSTQIYSSAIMFNCILKNTWFITPDDGATIVNCLHNTYEPAIFSYNVADLPSLIKVGTIAFALDADTPIYNETVVGGGATFVKVMWTGSTWVCN